MQLAPAEYGALYSLLGRCLLLELDADTVALLATPAMASVLGKLDAEFAPYVNRAWGPAEFDDAAAEYCALFVLPKGVTLNASYWIPGVSEDIGHQLVAGVRQVLDNFGLTVEALNTGNVPKDNIGLLLLLAAHLYQLEDEQRALEYGDEFVAQFVVPWGAAFCEALLARTNSPVYRALGQLLAELLSAATSAD